MCQASNIQTTKMSLCDWNDSFFLFFSEIGHTIYIKYFDWNDTLLILDIADSDACYKDG